jgi:hypothetical protein
MLLVLKLLLEVLLLLVVVVDFIPVSIAGVMADLPVAIVLL